MGTYCGHCTVHLTASGSVRPQIGPLCGQMTYLRLKGTRPALCVADIVCRCRLSRCLSAYELEGPGQRAAKSASPIRQRPFPEQALMQVEVGALKRESARPPLSTPLIFPAYHHHHHRHFYFNYHHYHPQLQLSTLSPPPAYQRCQPLELKACGRGNATALLQSQNRRPRTSLSSHRTTSSHRRHGLHPPGEGGRSRRTARRYRPPRTWWRSLPARRMSLAPGRACRHSANQTSSRSYSDS